MTLTSEEKHLVGALVPSNRGLHLEPLYDYYGQIVHDRRKWLETRTFAMNYPISGVRYKRIEVVSKDLEKYPAIFDSRVSPHGEERYATIALALAAPDIVDYAHDKGVGVRISVADNPWGLEICNRYNPEYHARNARIKTKFHGTNDAVRFQLPNGRWTDVIEGGREGARKINKWVVADERDLLPIEASLPIRRLRRLMKTGEIDFKRQRIVFFDPHEDHISTEDEKERPSDGLPGDGAYFSGYGHMHDYAEIVRKIEKVAKVPILRNRQVDTGDGGTGMSNQVGQVYKFDGTLANLYFLLGAGDAVTVDFREEVRTPEMKTAIGIFARGLIDMIA